MRLVLGVPSFARRLYLLLLPVPHMFPEALDPFSLTLTGLQALCQC